MVDEVLNGELMDISPWQSSTAQNEIKKTAPVGVNALVYSVRELEGGYNSCLRCRLEPKTQQN